MRISNTNLDAIIVALAKTNAKFGGNVRFRRFEPANKAGTIFEATLRVNDIHSPGARLAQSTTSKGNHRHLSNACWHVHGTFFDALNPEAIIYAGGLKIRPGDTWNDRNIGSMMQPMYYSEACEC